MVGDFGGEAAATAILHLCCYILILFGNKNKLLKSEVIHIVTEKYSMTVAANYFNRNGFNEFDVRKTSFLICSLFPAKSPSHQRVSYNKLNGLTFAGPFGDWNNADFVQEYLTNCLHSLLSVVMECILLLSAS